MLFLVLYTPIYTPRISGFNKIIQNHLRQYIVADIYFKRFYKTWQDAKLAELQGVSSNPIFSELSDWEEELKALDWSVLEDSNQNEIENSQISENSSEKREEIKAEKPAPSNQTKVYGGLSL